MPGRADVRGAARSRDPRRRFEHAGGLHPPELDAATHRRITVSTIHRAKGTEAQLVVPLGDEEQPLRSWRSLLSPDPERRVEERRLFYVAARAAGFQLEP